MQRDGETLALSDVRSVEDRMLSVPAAGEVLRRIVDQPKHAGALERAQRRADARFREAFPQRFDGLSGGLSAVARQRFVVFPCCARRRLAGAAVENSV
jgi:hypothetical protein